MKSILKKPAMALAVVATGLSACGDATTPEKTIIGTIAAGAAANALGANSNVTAAAAVAGAVALPLVTRATNAGCQLSSRPSGALVFRSAADGAYLNCQSVGLNNKTVQDLRSDPEWKLQTSSGSTTRRGGSVVRNGFN